ncbi:3-beta-hydroxysteroid-Delta(8),Delta(7)-isomerase [Acrasis kona]|uniref:3-beta-hydroxysteroid-Delta(8), Delta(7)-isomerase n=1 Tax=Acrasis kona TaxID=1008807 RepID=A0AAW2ZKD8_9EUKA
MVDINKYTYIPRWIVIWLILGNLIAGWDALYVVLRPLSADGGILSFFFPAHKLYILRDKRYADDVDAFVVAQAVIGLSEVILSLFAVGLQWYSVKRRPLACLLALIACVMTSAKTIMYVAIESLDGFKYTKHNNIINLTLYFILPMGLWTIAPAIAAYDLVKRLDTAMVTVIEDEKNKIK